MKRKVLASTLVLCILCLMAYPNVAFARTRSFYFTRTKSTHVITPKEKTWVVSTQENTPATPPEENTPVIEPEEETPVIEPEEETPVIEPEEETPVIEPEEETPVIEPEEETPVIEPVIPEEVLPVDNSGLAAAISNANALYSEQASRVNLVGDNDRIALAGAWETYNDSVAAYGNAITAAETIKGDPVSTQEDVDNAVVDLSVSTATFNMAKQAYDEAEAALAAARTSLTTAISDATILLEGTAVGTANGQVSQAAHDDYLAAITAAGEANIEIASAAQLDAAREALAAATAAFKLAIIEKGKYYVSNSGDDSNPGTSPDKPWKTIAKVNSFNFLPGDVIHFMSGDVWREQLDPVSGNEDGHVKYTSYGTGVKPLLLGSVDRSKASDWVSSGSNIWTLAPSSQKITSDIGNIIFNNGNAFGIKVYSQSELNKQNAFWYDANNQTVKIYSKSNPGVMYNSIECAVTKNIIDINVKSYLIFEGLALKYGGAHGIGGCETNNIIIRNCDISYMGGGYLDGSLRYGNGIEFYNNAQDNLVDGCNIWEIYDAALTNQGSGSSIRQYNITYTNNRIWNAEWSYEYWNYSAKGRTQGIYFENNICKNAGSGWGHSQRSNPSGMHLCLPENTAATSGVYIRNNVFEYSTSCTLYTAKTWNGIENLVLENNKYAQPKNEVVVTWGQLSKNYLGMDFSKYQQDTGKDRSSALYYSGDSAYLALNN